MIREIFFPTNPSTSALLNASIFSNSIRTLKISLFRSCNRPKKIKKWEFCTQNLEIQYDPIKIWKEFDFISTKSKAAKRPLSRLSPTDGPDRTPVTDGKSRPDRNSRSLIRSRDGTRKCKLQQFKSRIKLQKTCNFPPIRAATDPRSRNEVAPIENQISWFTKRISGFVLWRIKKAAIPRRKGNSQTKRFSWIETGDFQNPSSSGIDRTEAPEWRNREEGRRNEKEKESDV